MMINLPMNGNSPIRAFVRANGFGEVCMTTVPSFSPSPCQLGHLCLSNIHFVICEVCVTTLTLNSQGRRASSEKVDV
jgi:hypothetical protein